LLLSACAKNGKDQADPLGSGTPPIGAHENSDWSNGKLVIDANHGPIHLLQAAFYAVKLEVQRRHQTITPFRASYSLH